MANYASTTDIQNTLGVQSPDAFTLQRWNFLLGVTTQMINNILGDLHQGQHTEQICRCHVDERDGSFVVKNINVTAINKIDGNTYSGTLGMDYNIRYGRKIYINNLGEYVVSRNYNYFDITYTSGFSTIPEDIKYLQCLMVAGELAKEAGKSITAYKLGPRSVNFSDEESAKTAKQIYSFYNTFNI